MHVLYIYLVNLKALKYSAILFTVCIHTQILGPKSFSILDSLVVKHFSLLVCPTFWGGRLPIELCSCSRCGRANPDVTLSLHNTSPSHLACIAVAGLSDPAWAMDHGKGRPRSQVMGWDNKSNYVPRLVKGSRRGLPPDVSNDRIYDDPSLALQHEGEQRSADSMSIHLLVRQAKQLGDALHQWPAQYWLTLSSTACPESSLPPLDDRKCQAYRRSLQSTPQRFMVKCRERE